MTRQISDVKRVQVTAPCIAAGVREHTVRCPVAMAIAVAGGTDIAVHLDSIRVDWPWFRPVTYRVGATLADWIRAFDRGQEVEPVTVVLEVEASQGGEPRALAYLGSPARSSGYQPELMEVG